MKLDNSHSAESVDADALLEWLKLLPQALRGEGLDEVLMIEGLHAVDLLQSTLFFTSLNSLRAGKIRRPTFVRRLWWPLRAEGRRRRAEWQARRARARSAPIAQADVLLWPREITHVAVLLPVARVLERLAVSHAVLTCQLQCFEDVRARRQQVTFAGAAWDAENRDDYREGMRRANRLKRDLPWNIPRLEHPRADLLRDVLRRVLYEYLPQACIAVANARLAIEQFRPRVLVIGNDLTVEGRAAARVAKQRGVPTAALMHGSLANNPLHATHCTDRFLVQGEVHRQDLLARGLSTEQIVVSGAPHLDDRTRQSGQISASLRRVCGLRPGAPWILAATSGPGISTSLHHHRTIVANLKRLAARFPDLPLLVKLHRKDRPEHYQELLADCDPTKVFVIPKSDSRLPYDIFEWLQGCTGLLTTTSTVAVEAMLMEVPVISMDYCNEARGVDFIDSGATVHVRSYEELEAAVGKLLAEGQPPEVRAAAERYVEGAFGRLDGRAAERSAHEICRLGSIAVG